ncbi:hypothetical protein J6T21_00200 [Candidatus Saccharibacteria bacterium]|nr:hypothetical protein [Candidatus Saccharibacteria bacterium]
MPPLQTPTAPAGGMPNGVVNGDNTMYTMTDATIPPVDTSKDKKSLLIYIACGAIALISIIIAIFAFMDSSNKAAELKKIKKQFAGGEEVVIDGETVSPGSKAKNPVISGANPDIYNIEYESINYELDDGATYRFSLAIRDGEVFTCSSKEFRSSPEGYKETNRKCAVNNVSGKIYKVFDILDADDSQNDLLGFLLEDGTIDFVKIYVGLKNMQFNVLGKINAGGFVSDAMKIKAFQQDSISGKEVVVFTLPDGKYAQYKKSMLKYN